MESTKPNQDGKMHPIFEQIFKPYMPDLKTSQDEALQKIIDECNVVLKLLTLDELKDVTLYARNTLTNIKNKDVKKGNQDE